MELLIKNGIVIDGSGSPAEQMDVLIEDGKIIRVASNIESSSARVIDAKGKYSFQPSFLR